MLTRNAGDLDPQGAPGEAMLKSVLREHRTQSPRLFELKDYLERRHRIDSRMRRRGLPNNRLSHDLPGYITRTAAGYLIGDAIRYEGDQPALNAIRAAYAATDAESVDCELAVDASAYGRAVELCFADERAMPRVAQADPLRCFVVYASDALHRPLFGVSTGETRDECGKVTGMFADVYTATEVLHWQGRTASTLALTARERHYFGDVPMIEYWNNPQESGDFEGVLPLIDAYDALQSDRVNDKQQFTDAILVLYGVAGLAEEDGRGANERLREEKTLCMPDGDARVEFLTKQLSESDTEVLKDSLRADIHKLCFVPDMTDEQFAGNQSGVALRYKLFGLEQLTRIKERWFREGLRQRLRLFGHYLELRGGQPLNADAVNITFPRRELWQQESGDEAWRNG